jgi:hypothetical protein
MSSKNTSPLSSGDLCWWLTSSPVPFIEGFWFLPLWIAAYFSGDLETSNWGWHDGGKNDKAASICD